MMGRQEELPSPTLLSDYAQRLHDTLPIPSQTLPIVSYKVVDVEFYVKGTSQLTVHSFRESRRSFMHRRSYVVRRKEKQ